MEFISIILVLAVAFLAGMESILDEFQFHQPVVACTLIGMAYGDITKGIILGGSLQLLALGWMNIGAAVAPDAALASVISAILVCGPSQTDIATGIAIAVPLAVVGLVLTTICRTITVGVVHVADGFAERGNLAGAEWTHIGALAIQGFRGAIPAGIVIAVGAEPVNAALSALPDWLSKGLSVAGGFIVVVGYAMVINMIATPELWPFFMVGFALSALSELNLIAMGILGVCLALIYIQLSPKFNGSGNAQVAGSGDALDDVLNDF
jgi:PTS system mannose-specific IIC component